MSYDRGIPDDFVRPRWHYVVAGVACVVFWAGLIAVPFWLGWGQ